MEDHLTFDFSFDVSGKIWQLAFDESSGQIGIEVRDEKEQELYFLIFDILKIEISDYFHIPAADWWSTIIGLRSGKILLDKYLDPQDPTKKSLVIFDSQGVSELIEIDDFQLSEIIDNAIIGTSASDKSVIKKHELITQISSEINSSNPSVGFPVFEAEGSETFVLVTEYLNKELSIGVEYYEVEECIIFSYYVRSGAKFDRKLVMIKDGVELVHSIQDKGLSGYASGAFFIMSGYLIFISNSNQINGIKI